MNCIKLSNYKQCYLYRANKLVCDSGIVLKGSLKVDLIWYPLASCNTKCIYDSNALLSN